MAKVGQAESVTGLIDAIKAWKKPPSGGLLAYRGQQNSNWKPEPGILRSPLKLYQHEREAARDLMSIHPQEFLSDNSMFDRLVRMQHYGLRTRLLDVSVNPLVALYFATAKSQERGLPADGKVFVFTVPPSRKKYFDSDAISCVANLANLSPQEKDEILSSSNIDDIDEFNTVPSVDKLSQFVRAEKPYFRSKIDKTDLMRPYFVTPKMSNRRIIAQSGSFIIFGLSDTQEQSPKKDPIQGDHILIPSGAKNDIRSELDTLGINESTLFPELDQAASYIMRRYSS